MAAFFPLQPNNICWRSCEYFRIEWFSERGNRKTATFLPEVPLSQGWDKTQTIDSLLRKGGFKGVVTPDVRRSIRLVRYQSERLTVSYQDYLHHCRYNNINDGILFNLSKWLKLCNTEKLQDSVMIQILHRTRSQGEHWPLPPPAVTCTSVPLPLPFSCHLLQETSSQYLRSIWDTVTLQTVDMSQDHHQWDLHVHHYKLCHYLWAIKNISNLNALFFPLPVLLQIDLLDGEFRFSYCSVTVSS